VVSGSTLNLVCNPYPNNTAPTGISSTAPAGAKASPVIASTTGSAAPPAATATTAAPTATTAAPTATTAAPATAPSSLATTGPGPHLWLVAVVGFIVLYLGSVVLALVERPRSLLRRALRLAPHSPAMAIPVPVPVQMATVSPVVDRSVWLSEPAMVQPIVKPSVKPAYPKAGGSSGLWFDGWEPQDRTRD
jgi:hypothetical protein